MHITQSALSKQITEIEQQHKFHLFNRKNKRTVELTDVGRIFVEEARSALLHIDRAVQLGCAAREGSDGILTIGHSSDADQVWVSGILAIRLPLYPKDLLSCCKYLLTPEKGWHRRLNSVPGHHHSKVISSFLTKLLSPLSVRYFSARSGPLPGHDDGQGLKLELPLAQSAFSPLPSAAWLKIATSIAPRSHANRVTGVS
jgi:hypothetical protein